MAETTSSKGAATSRVHLWWTVLLLLAVTAAFFAGRATRRGTTGHVPPAAVERAILPDSMARCVKILDGDTIRVDWKGQEEDVRILGIDCPETKQGKKLVEQAQSLRIKQEYVLRYGEIAKKTTGNWLLDRDVTLVFPNNEVSRDSFGRLLCYVEDQGVDIGERLLAGGNAFLWESEHPRRETYSLLETEAKRQSKGVWRRL